MAGDVGAFEQIVRLHQQSVWRFLRRLLGDPTAAEDVAQETFLRVYRRLPTYAFRARFSTWVFQIARNAGLDELRRAAAGRPGGAGPCARAGGGRGRRHRRGSRSTPPWPPCPVDQREALLLVEVLGLRYAEAAAVLGVPVGTVKSRVFGARRAPARPGPTPETSEPTRRPAMRCDDARLGVSLRADGERPGRRRRTTSTPTSASCPDVPARSRPVVQDLRAPACGSRPSTTSPTSDRPCSPGCGPRPRPGRRDRPRRDRPRRGAPATAVPAPRWRWRPRSPPSPDGRRGATFVGRRPRARPSPAAADVPEPGRRGAGRRRRPRGPLHRLRGGHRRRRRRARSTRTSTYRAPEALALHVQETTAGAAPARARRRARSSSTATAGGTRSTRPCSPAAGLVRCPAAPTAVVAGGHRAASRSRTRPRSRSTWSSPSTASPSPPTRPGSASGPSRAPGRRRVGDRGAGRPAPRRAVRRRRPAPRAPGRPGRAVARRRAPRAAGRGGRGPATTRPAPRGRRPPGGPRRPGDVVLQRRGHRGADQRRPGRRPRRSRPPSAVGDASTPGSARRPTASDPPSRSRARPPARRVPARPGRDGDDPRRPPRRRAVVDRRAGVVHRPGDRPGGPASVCSATSGPTSGPSTSAAPGRPTRARRPADRRCTPPGSTSSSRGSLPAERPAADRRRARGGRARRCPPAGPRPRTATPDRGRRGAPGAADRRRRSTASVRPPCGSPPRRGRRHRDRDPRRARATGGSCWRSGRGTACRRRRRRRDRRGGPGHRRALQRRRGRAGLGRGGAGVHACAAPRWPPASSPRLAEHAGAGVRRPPLVSRLAGRPSPHRPGLVAGAVVDGPGAGRRTSARAAVAADDRDHPPRPSRARCRPPPPCCWPGRRAASTRRSTAAASADPRGHRLVRRGGAARSTWSASHDAAGGAVVDAPAPAGPSRSTPWRSTPRPRRVRRAAPTGRRSPGSARARRCSAPRPPSCAGSGPGGSLTLAGGGEVTVAGGRRRHRHRRRRAGGRPGDRSRRSGIGTDRYLLVAHARRPVRRLEARLRAALPPDRAGPVPRRGRDAVPAARRRRAAPGPRSRQRFGEFAYRPAPGDAVRAGPGLAGRAPGRRSTCRSSGAPAATGTSCGALDGALREVVDAGLAASSTPQGSPGAGTPARPAAATGISRHAWGVAVDLNAGAEPDRARLGAGPAPRRGVRPVGVHRRQRLARARRRALRVRVAADRVTGGARRDAPGINRRSAAGPARRSTGWRPTRRPRRSAPSSRPPTGTPAEAIRVAGPRPHHRRPPVRRATAPRPGRRRRRCRRWPCSCCATIRPAAPSTTVTPPGHVSVITTRSPSAASS